MSDQKSNTDSITVADLAAALRLPADTTKADVLNALGNLRPGGGRPPRKLSKVYESQAHYDALKKQSVKVRVTAPHPIAERGAVYYPAVLEPNGRVKTPADVFVTDRARLAKIASMVEEVDRNTPTTAELEARKKEARAELKEIQRS